MAILPPKKRFFGCVLRLIYNITGSYNTLVVCYRRMYGVYNWFAIAIIIS